MSEFIGDSQRHYNGISSVLKIDAKIFIAILLITFLGLVTIYSSSSGDLSLVIKQATRIVTYNNSGNPNCYRYFYDDIYSSSSSR